MALIQLQNDFKDLYIYDICVESQSAFNKVTEIKKSYAPGELISLSTYVPFLTRPLPFWATAAFYPKKTPPQLRRR